MPVGLVIYFMIKGHNAFVKTLDMVFTSSLDRSGINYMVIVQDKDERGRYGSDFIEQEGV